MNSMPNQPSRRHKSVRVTEPSRQDGRDGQMTGCNRCCHDNLLLFLMMIGVCLGIGVGICLRLFVPVFQTPELHPREMMYLFFPAEVVIRILGLLTMPLIVSSLISAIGILDAKISGRVGLMVLFYYISTTFLAVMEGFLLEYTIQPGKTMKNFKNTTYASQDMILSQQESGNQIDSLLDMIRNIFPENLITATFHMYSSHVTHTNVTHLHGDTAVFTSVEQLSNQPVQNMNILGMTVMSLVFGAALSAIGPKGKLLFCVFDAIFDTVMKIMKIVFWLYPLAMVFMLAHTVVELKDPVDLLKKMFIFVITVLLGLFIHIMFVLPALLLIFARRNPYKHLLRCMKALFTGFATGNSTVTIPVTIDCLEKAGYSDRVIRFMVPMGASINMDGFALYEAMAAIFIATLNGMVPGPVEAIILGLTAVAVSIGAPTAGSGLVLYVILFKSIGLPLEDIALLLPYDWILGRFRTMTNIWGDCVGVAVVHSLAKKQLQYHNTEPRHIQSHRRDDYETTMESHSSGPEINDYEHEQPVLTRFSRLGEKDWSLRLTNESGDSIYVSKV